MAGIYLKNEPSRHPRKEYVYKSWRVQIDRHPKQLDRWDWMIEERNNGPVYWHRTTEEPTFAEIGEYIEAQGY